ncbi:hypothetical protein ACTXT7_006704 [Hymenolepis weldensis]
MENEMEITEPLNEIGHETKVVKSVEDVDASKVGCTESIFSYDFASLAQTMAHSAEEFVRQVWLRGWGLVQFTQLPQWMKDNDFIKGGHRPALNSYWACAKSIFRIHTETGNIWTHLLDYTGIAVLTIGSFVPYLYYTFYCDFAAMVGYLSLICVLGVVTICVSMLDAFSTPRFRPVRAGSFIGLGLSGVIPATHYSAVVGWKSAVYDGSLGWLIIMAVLYISGALLYALRIPERCLSGYCDIWQEKSVPCGTYPLLVRQWRSGKLAKLESIFVDIPVETAEGEFLIRDLSPLLTMGHQIFHVFVVAAALVHYYGVSMISDFRLSRGDCKPTLPLNFTDIAFNA